MTETMADELRRLMSVVLSEAGVADRPGQMERLEAVADGLAELARRLDEQAGGSQ